MKTHIIVLSVIWGLIAIAIISITGSMVLIYCGKEIPEGLSVTVVASCVAALGAILSRTGHDPQPSPPIGTVEDPLRVKVDNPPSQPVNTETVGSD